MCLREWLTNCVRDLSPGEMFEGENTCYDIENPARNEQRYLNIMRKHISELNVGMPLFGIMDTSRTGVFGIRRNWGDWCNVNGAGFGRSPSSNTGDKNLDAFIWAKWGGISDGTSDPAAYTYNSFCGLDDAFKPMPERGGFSQAYFEMLLREWKPKGYFSGLWNGRRRYLGSRKADRRCG